MACGRFTLTYRNAELLAAELGVPIESLIRHRPRYNIAPNDLHWIAGTRFEDREILPARWGLINFWMTDRKHAFENINARAEATAAPTPTPSPSPTPTPAGSATATATQTVTPTPTASLSPGAELTQGAIDCDGSVDEDDAFLVLEYAAGLTDGAQDAPCPDIGEESGGEQWGDLNCDGVVDVGDVLVLLLFLADLPTGVSPPCVPPGELIG